MRISDWSSDVCSSDLGPDLAQGTLVELMPGYRSIELGIHVVYATRKQLPMKTRRLVDFLVGCFRQPACRPGRDLQAASAARMSRRHGSRSNWPVSRRVTIATPCMPMPRELMHSQSEEHTSEL